MINGKFQTIYDNFFSSIAVMVCLVLMMGLDIYYQLLLHRFMVNLLNKKYNIL